MSEMLRRLSAVLLAVALAVAGLTHGIRAPDMGLNMAMAAASEMPVPDQCDGCGNDQKGMTSAACSAHCASAVALPLISLVFDRMPAATVAPVPEPSATGHADPPDPYPPRPAVLS
jgi:hypothetical protein